MPYLHRLLLLLFCSASYAGLAFGQTGGKLTMKSGAVMEYQEARVEGGEIVMRLPHGMMRLPVSLVSEDSMARLVPRPEAGTPTADAVGEVHGVAAVVAKPGTTEEAGKSPKPSQPSLAEVAAEKSPAQPAAVDRGELFRDPFPASLEMRPAGGDKNPTRLIEAEIEGKLAGNPKVKFSALVPVDKMGQPTKGAADIVFYAPYINQGKPLEGERFARELAERYGMTVFSMSVRSRFEDVEDETKCYYYKESGSFDMVVEFWEKLVSDLRLPQRKLLVAGNSGGSTMAQRFAMAYPDKIDAVVLMGGWRFAAFERALVFPWLLLATRDDVREVPSQELAESGRKLGMNMLVGRTPVSWQTPEQFREMYSSTNFRHTMSDSGLDIAQEFLCAIRDRRENSAQWRDPSRWPLRAPASAPWLVTKNSGAAPASGDEVVFPSEHFAELWMRNELRQAVVEGASHPVPVRYPTSEGRRASETNPSGQAPPTQAVPPGSSSSAGAPKGIVLYGGGAGDAVDIGDDMDLLGILGYIAVDVGTQDDAGACLEWVLGHKPWEKLPVFLLGLNEYGNVFLRLARDRHGGRIKAVGTIDALLGPDAHGPDAPHVLLCGGDRAKRDDFLLKARAAGVRAETVEAENDQDETRRFALIEKVVRAFDEK